MQMALDVTLHGNKMPKVFQGMKSPHIFRYNYHRLHHDKNNSSVSWDLALKLLVQVS